MQSLGPSDIIQMVFQVTIPDTKENNAFISFIKHLLWQSEAGSLE